MVPKADFARRNAAFLYGEKQAHITSGMFMDVSDADDLIDSIEDAIRADPIAVSG